MSIIYREGFNDILRIFTDAKRATLNDLFSEYLNDGLNEFRVKEAVRSLKNRRPDGISSDDLDKVEHAVLEKLASQK